MNVCLDLFSGTRSATKYFAKAGWEMHYVEISDGKDILDLKLEIPKADFVWASPPCTEYSYFNRKFGTWESKYDADPTLWLVALARISQARPRYWIIENVKGAQQRWGRAPFHYGPYFLWGYFPEINLPHSWSISMKGTHADRSKTTEGGNVLQWDDGKSASEKAMIPDALAKAVFGSIDNGLSLRNQRDDFRSRSREYKLLTNRIGEIEE